MDYTIEYQGNDFPHLQYLNLEQKADLKRALGILKWIKLMTGDFEVVLEGARCIQLDKDQPILYALKNKKGIYLDYRHGYEESFDTPESQKRRDRIFKEMLK